MITVLLADDQHLVRGALAALLSLEDDITVVGEVGRGDALAAVERLQPDVVLVDIEMPGLDGLAATAILTTVAPKAGFLTSRRSGARAISGGHGGRGARVRREGHAGQATGRRRPAGVPGRAGCRSHPGCDDARHGSQPTHRPSSDVLIAVRDGATVGDIARRLFLGEGTVRNYLPPRFEGSRKPGRRCARPRSGWL